MKSFWWDLQLHISVIFTPIDFKFSHNNINMLYINIKKFKKNEKNTLTPHPKMTLIYIGSLKVLWFKPCV